MMGEDLSCGCSERNLEVHAQTTDHIGHIVFSRVFIKSLARERVIPFKED